MANPIGLNGTHNRQEKYVSQIVPLYRKELVVRNEFARDYSGDPVNGAVQVPVRETDVALGNYDIATGGALTQSATTFLTIPLTKHKHVNEIIDGYEAASVPDSLVAQRLESGAYSVGLTLELNAINELVTNGTAESSTTALTNSNAYKSIKDSIIATQKLGINKSLMVVFISDEVEGLLLEDEKFSNSAGALGAELIRDGVVGKIAGVRVKTSSNLPANVEYIVGAKPWMQAIDAWKVNLDIKDLGNEFIGASALQGRMIYEDKLTKSTACRVKKTSASV